MAIWHVKHTYLTMYLIVSINFWFHANKSMNKFLKRSHFSYIMKTMNKSLNEQFAKIKQEIA